MIEPLNESLISNKLAIIKPPLLIAILQTFYLSIYYLFKINLMTA